MFEETGELGIEHSKLPAGIDGVTEKYTLAGGEDWADAIDKGHAAGGMSKVIFAKDDLGRDVAIKFSKQNARLGKIKNILKKLPDDQKDEAYFEQMKKFSNVDTENQKTLSEARVAANQELDLSVHVTNVTKFTDEFGNEHLGLVMTQVEQDDFLNNRIENGQLPPEAVSATVDTLCKIIDKPNIVHRDIKPANIVVDNLGDDNNPHWRARMLDWGLSSQMVNEGHVKPISGTETYKAPEYEYDLYDSDPNDPRQDVYSAGIAIYEMLAGKKINLYKGDLRPNVEAEHKKTIKEKGYEDPDAIMDFIKRCTAHDADNRFQNGHQMREEAIRVGLILQ